MSHPNFICCCLTPNGMMLEGRALGRSLGHEGGGLMSGISALLKRDKGDDLSLSLPSKGTRRRQPSANQEEGFSQTPDLVKVILDFSSL